MKKMIEKLLPAGLALLTTVVLLYLLYAEISRRGAIEREFTRIDTFIQYGPRFPFEYGMILCERIQLLEAEHMLESTPIDCQTLRAAFTASRQEP